MTKAITAEGDQMRSGPNWALSRRGILKVFDDHLECGDWRIDYANIQQAVLYSFRSHILRIPGYVLNVKTADKNFHFGLNWGKFWKGDLPFPVRREQGRLGLTWFSFVVRLIVVGCLLYLAWIWWTAR